MWCTYTIHVTLVQLVSYMYVLHGYHAFHELVSQLLLLILNIYPPPPPVRTETKQETLDNSLLSYMGQSASEADLREAFCRDVDAYSFEFDKNQVAGPRPGGPGGPRDEKPAKCDVLPQTACAVAYDSGTCSGGWKLVIPIGELRYLAPI